MDRISVPKDHAENELKLPPNMSIEEWNEMGERLIQVGEGVNWWLGDWMVYGETKWPEEFDSGALFLSEKFNRSIKVIHTCSNVSRSIPPSRRRHELSWSHHNRVCEMNAAAQNNWLALCVKEGWSVRQLSDQVRASMKVTTSSGSKKKEPKNLEPTAEETEKTQEQLQLLDAVNKIKQADESVLASVIEAQDVPEIDDLRKRANNTDDRRTGSKLYREAMPKLVKMLDMLKDAEGEEEEKLADAEDHLNQFALIVMNYLK